MEALEGTCEEMPQSLHVSRLPMGTTCEQGGCVPLIRRKEWSLVILFLIFCCFVVVFFFKNLGTVIDVFC